MSLALVFPGQGSQYAGMGKKLYNDFPEVHALFEEANDCLGFDIKKLCLTGEMTELTDTRNAQPAIFLTAYAHFTVYMKRYGITPLCTAGHSLGEITALACAGSISFTDGLLLTRKRGELMDEASNHSHGGMSAVIGLSSHVVENVCKELSSDGETLCCANYNSPEQVVISGTKSSLNMAKQKLSTMGARINPLCVSAPFHSPLMSGVEEKFSIYLEDFTFHKFHWPVISNTHALPYVASWTIKNTLTRQITSPVLWSGTMELMRKNCVKIIVEVGPGAILRNLARKNIDFINAFSMDSEEDLHSLGQFLEKKAIKKEEPSRRYFGTVITKSLAMAVSLKNNCNDEATYLERAVLPFNAILRMQQELEENHREPTKEQLIEAVSMLKSVMKIKTVPVDEQRKRLEQILEETGIKDDLYECIKG